MLKSSDIAARAVVSLVLSKVNIAPHFLRMKAATHPEFDQMHFVAVLRWQNSSSWPNVFTLIGHFVGTSLQKRI